MKPTEFKESNTTFGKNQPNYSPLPALSFKDSQGIVITCWKLSFFERMKLIFTGRIWLSSMTFLQPLQPLYLTVNKNEVIIYNKEGQ